MRYWLPVTIVIRLFNILFTFLHSYRFTHLFIFGIITELIDLVALTSNKFSFMYDIVLSNIVIKVIWIIYLLLSVIMQYVSIITRLLEDRKNIFSLNISIANLYGDGISAFIVPKKISVK